MRVPTTTVGPGLPGPAATRHQPREIDVRIRSLPGGRLRVSSPHARGWAVIARNETQLAQAIGTAFLENAVAAYAKWHRQRYDLDKLTSPDDPTEPRVAGARGGSVTGQGRPVSSEPISYGRGAAVRPDASHPAHWTLNDDGTYTSPAGRTYRDPKFIAALEVKRAKFNLPIRNAAS